MAKTQVISKIVPTYIISTNKILVDLKDMTKLRIKLKEMGYYKKSLDSLTYLEDGNDYGLGIKDEKEIVNFIPYLESKDSIIQYYWDSTNKKCAKKTFEVDLDTYIDTISKKFKPQYIDYKEVNLNTTKEELLKNFLIRYSYIAEKLYSKKTNDNKIKKVFKKLEDSSYTEIVTNFNKSIESIGGEIIKPKKAYNAGFTLIKSTSYLFIIFGILVCIISFILYLII